MPEPYPQREGYQQRIGHGPGDQFNVDQCDSLPTKITQPAPAKVRNSETRDPIADEFLSATKANIREGRGESYFAPGRDFTSLPAFEAFKGADRFYNKGLIGGVPSPSREAEKTENQTCKYGTVRDRSRMSLVERWNGKGTVGVTPLPLRPG